MRNREHTMRGQRDYSLGKVYKIVDTETNDCYVGSTVMPLCKRLSMHKTHKSKTGASKHFEEFGWGRARIVLVEDYPCDHVDQLRAREEHWRVELKATLNQVRAHAGLPDGTPSRREDKKSYAATYYATHAEELRTVSAAYRAEHREEARAYGAAYRAKHREKARAYAAAYYAEHREDFLASKAAYYASKKQQINDKRREKILCPHCNTELSRGALSAHIHRMHASQPINYPRVEPCACPLPGIFCN